MLTLISVRGGFRMRSVSSLSLALVLTSLGISCNRTNSAAVALAVTVSPHTAALNPGGTTTFTAAVTGTTADQSTAVTWSVQETGGGTVDATGFYTAPAAPGTYH